MFIPLKLIVIGFDPPPYHKYIHIIFQRLGYPILETGQAGCRGKSRSLASGQMAWAGGALFQDVGTTTRNVGEMLGKYWETVGILYVQCSKMFLFNNGYFVGAPFSDKAECTDLAWRSSICSNMVRRNNRFNRNLHHDIRIYKHESIFQF